MIPICQCKFSFKSQLSYTLKGFVSLLPNQTNPRGGSHGRRTLTRLVSLGDLNLPGNPTLLLGEIRESCLLGGHNCQPSIQSK